MENNVKPIAVKSAVDLLIERISQEIIDSKFKPGEQIPTENVLASTYGVGRNTVREAVKTLASYGILEIKRASGTFVCDSFKPQSINPLLYGMIISRDKSYKDLINFRKVLEGGILVFLAMKHLSKEETDTLYSLCKHLENAIRSDNVELIIEYDIKFHTKLAEYCDTPLIVLVNDMVTKLTLSSRRKTVEDIIKNNRQEYLINVHYDLLDKIIKGDVQELLMSQKDSYFYWEGIYN